MSCKYSGNCRITLVWKGHFSTDDHTIYYSGNEKGGSNGVAFITNSFISKHVLGNNPVSDMITEDFNAKVGEGCNMKMNPGKSVRIAWEVEMREVVHLSISA